MIYILYYILSLLQSLHIITGGYILLQSIYTILSLLYYFYIIYIYICMYVYIYICISTFCVFAVLCACCAWPFCTCPSLRPKEPMSPPRSRQPRATWQSQTGGETGGQTGGTWGDLKNDHLSTTNWKTKISHCFFCCYPSLKLVSSIRMSIKWRVYQWEFQDPKMEVR